MPPNLKRKIDEISGSPNEVVSQLVELARSEREKGKKDARAVLMAVRDHDDSRIRNLFPSVQAEYNRLRGSRR